MSSFRRVREYLKRSIANRRASWRILREIRTGNALPIRSLCRYEKTVFSQNGEDGILEAIFTAIGTTNKFFVEFGGADGMIYSNTALLELSCGWKGLLMDASPLCGASCRKVEREFVTAENINELFRRYGVPESFDLLSIDIDGNDYWVWKAIEVFRPRVVVLEYNASVPPDEARTIAYEPSFQWAKTNYFGASLKALADLGAAKGYRLVGCNQWGVNAFFVDQELAAGRFLEQAVEELYRPPLYNDGRGHPADPTRTMVPL